MQEMNLEHRDTDLELPFSPYFSFPIFVPKRKLGTIKINPKLDVIHSKES